jgi:hypothetical protein
LNRTRPTVDYKRKIPSQEALRYEVVRIGARQRAFPLRTTRVAVINTIRVADTVGVVVVVVGIATVSACTAAVVCAMMAV